MNTLENIKENQKIVVSDEFPLIAQKPVPQPKNSIFKSLKFVTLVRCIYAILVLLYSIIWINSGDTHSLSLYTDFLLIAVVEIFVFTTICCIALLKNRFINALTYIGMMNDTVLAAFIVLITGYSDSPFLYLLLIIPLYGGIILKKRGGLIGAFMVSMVLLGMYFDIIPKLTVIMPDKIRHLLLMSIQDLPDIHVVPLVMASLGVGLLTGQLSSMYANAEENLIASERDFLHLRGVYEHMLNAIPVGVVIANVVSQTVVYANPSARAIFSDNELALFLTMLKPEPNTDKTWQLNLDGRYLQVVRFPFEMGLNDSLEGYYVTDITAQKQAEIEKSHRQRLELLGEFSAKVAHEIRNPLACISGCHEMLQADAQTEDQVQIHDMMGHEIERLNHLLGDILVFARTPKLKLEPQNLRDLLMEQRGIFLSDPALEDIEVEIEVPENFTLMADRTSLCQIVLTLWRNSAEAMENSGLIRVEADTSPNVIRFMDEGPGIPQDIVDRIFEPFFTTKSNGTGLGLATANQLARDNHLCLVWNNDQKCFCLTQLDG